MYKGLHEWTVKTFYSISASGFAKTEKNYLNFGLWNGSREQYVDAAERLIAKVGDKIGLNADSRVLDVACGMDAEPRLLRSRYKCKEIVAMDLTPEHSAIAQQRNADPAIIYVNGNACDIHFEKQSYSHILAVEGIAHFKPRQQFVARAKRMLEPGGKLGLADMVLKRKPRNKMEELLVQGAETVWLVPRENTETIESYTQKLDRKGFVDVDVEPVGEHVFPGYAKDHWRPDSWLELRKVRGSVPATAGLMMDLLVYGLYAMDLLEYVIVSAQKKPAMREI